MTKQSAAKLASIYAGLVFGIYWIPLRALAEAGFSGIWAAVIFNAVAFAIICPWFLYRWRVFIPGRLHLHSSTLLAGIAFVLYATSFLYTEVIRTILLFYFMPIWGFLLARIFIGEVITPIRWLSMAFGLVGLLIICGIDTGLPLPRNIGDWMALVAGLIWAAGSLLLLTDQQSKPVDVGLAFIFWSIFSSLLAALLISFYGLETLPAQSALMEVLPWLIPLAILVIVPANFATIYGPTQLNPGVVGLLFMTEISVATVSAALLAGEPFGEREILGVIFISLAGLAEPLMNVMRPGVSAST